MLKKVTITGADDTVGAFDLMQLSILFPFVEWGILLSSKRYGSPRYPTKSAIKLITEPWAGGKVKPNLSLHLCGQYVRDFLLGNFHFIDDIGIDRWQAFQRVQINTHGELHEFNGPQLARFIQVNPHKQFIFQYDNTNHTLIEFISGLKNVAVLHDLSSGTGILPTHWPDLIKGIDCGYAGGLGPDNLNEQIQSILSIAGDASIWIDMETHVRSNMGQNFDLEKVRKCLEIASFFIDNAWKEKLLKGDWKEEIEGEKLGEMNHLKEPDTER